MGSVIQPAGDKWPGREESKPSGRRDLALPSHGHRRMGVPVAANNGNLEMATNFQPWKQQQEGRTGSWSWERSSPGWEGLDFPLSSLFMLYKTLGNSVHAAKV